MEQKHDFIVLYIGILSFMVSAESILIWTCGDCNVLFISVMFFAIAVRFAADS